MRKIICAIAFAVSVGAVSVATGVAAPIGRDAPQAADYENVLQQVQYNRCDRLRRACENKDVRGEEGMGNCRRYREECGDRGSYSPSCAVLAKTRMSVASVVKAIADATVRNAASSHYRISEKVPQSA